jgi:hypothetical protein
MREKKLVLTSSITGTFVLSPFYVASGMTGVGAYLITGGGAYLTTGSGADLVTG